MSDHWDQDIDLNNYRGSSSSHPLRAPKTAIPFLEQTKFWINSTGQTIPVKSMDEDYCFAVLLWLRKRAAEMHKSINLYYNLIGQSHKISYDPELWIEMTPLYGRIVRRYQKLAATHITITPEIVETDVKTHSG